MCRNIYGINCHPQPCLHITENLHIALYFLHIAFYEPKHLFCIIYIEEFCSDNPSYFIQASKTDQCIASQYIEVDIGQWLQIIRLLDLCDEFEKEAQFADLDGFLHDVYTVEIVDDD